MEVMFIVKNYGDSIIEGANIDIVNDRCNNRLARALGTENLIAEIIALNNKKITLKDTKIIKNNVETIVTLVNYMKTSVMFKGAVINSQLSELKLKINALDETKDDNVKKLLMLNEQLNELEEKRISNRNINTKCMEIISNIAVNE